MKLYIPSLLVAISLAISARGSVNKCLQCTFKAKALSQTDDERKEAVDCKEGKISATECAGDETRSCEHCVLSDVSGSTISEVERKCSNNEGYVNRREFKAYQCWTDKYTEGWKSCCIWEQNGGNNETSKAGQDYNKNGSGCTGLGLCHTDTSTSPSSDTSTSPSSGSALMAAVGAVVVSCASFVWSNIN